MNVPHWMLALVALLVAAPLAAAQDNSTDAPDEINVDVEPGDDDGGDAEEATGFGMNTAVVLVLVVLAVMVIALVVAMANRP